MITIPKTKSQKKRRTEKLLIREILIEKDFELSAGVAQLAEHRPSKPMVTNHKSKSRRTKPALDNRSK